MGAVVLTQRPLTAFFRNERNLAAHWREGWREFVDGLAAGARNMTAVGIATATAGILVGTVTLTGIGLVMTEIVETPVGRQHHHHAGAGRRDLHHSRLRPADHRELRRGRDA